MKAGPRPRKSRAKECRLHNRRVTAIPWSDGTWEFRFKSLGVDGQINSAKIRLSVEALQVMMVAVVEDKRTCTDCRDAHTFSDESPCLECMPEGDNPNWRPMEQEGK